VVCAWEIDIKRSLGRLDAPMVVSADPQIARYPIQVIW